MKIENVEEKEKLICGSAGAFSFTAIVSPDVIDTITALNKHHRVLTIAAEQAGDCVMAFHVIMGNPLEKIETH